MNYKKFHICRGTSRSAVTVPVYISDLLAIENGIIPRTPGAYRFTQRLLLRFTGEGHLGNKSNFSQWLQKKPFYRYSIGSNSCLTSCGSKAIISTKKDESIDSFGGA